MTAHKNGSVYLIVILSLVLILIAACSAFSSAETIRGSGGVVSETRAVSGFHGILVAGIGELVIEQGETEALEIEAEDNLMEYLTSRVENGILVLATRDNVTLTPTRSIVYRVTVQEIDSLEISGAANVTAAGLSLSHLDTTVSGTANITLAGTVDDQTITFAGAGSYNAPDFISQEAVITLSGMGSAVLNVEDALDVTISGAGTVRYLGDPATITQDITGAGQLIGE